MAVKCDDEKQCTGNMQLVCSQFVAELRSNRRVILCAVPIQLHKVAVYIAFWLPTVCQKSELLVLFAFQKNAFHHCVSNCLASQVRAVSCFPVLLASNLSNSSLVEEEAAVATGSEQGLLVEQQQ